MAMIPHWKLKVVEGMLGTIVKYVRNFTDENRIRLDVKLLRALPPSPTTNVPRERNSF